LNTKKVIISGISSSVGISLARLLTLKGYLVVGFSRNPTKARKILHHPSIKIVTGDLLDRKFITSICNEAAAIIHLAAFSSPWGKYKDFYKVNVKGTKTIVEAAMICKVPRFIHVSTPSLYFDYCDKFDISENDPLPHKSVNAYAETKKIAETIIDDAFIKGLQCITIRPRAIFGPHDQTLLPRLLKTCKEKGVFHFKKNSPIVDITYVDNVSHALHLALEASSSCFGEKYNITNGEPLPLWNLIDQLLEKLSISRVIKKIPYPLAYGFASFLELVSKVNKKEPLLTRYTLGVMTYSQTLSIIKANTQLNYKPLISVKEGINNYVKWLQTT